MFESTQRCLATLAAMAGMMMNTLAADNPVDPKEFQAALTTLTQHVTGKAKLEEAAISKLTGSLKAHQQALSTDASMISDCHAFIRAYEKHHKPLWIGHAELNKKQAQEGDAIHWAVFWAMQVMIDQLYNDAGLQQHTEALDGLRFGVADYFPGKVSGTPSSHTVKISASYPDTWGHPVFHEERPARKPTGSWLVPGTIATVSVPESLVGKGYEVRVGAHSWDLEKKPRVNRLYRVSTVFPINSTEVKVANPVGGAIYIEVPYQAEDGVVEVTLNNIVRSPFFAMLPHNKTSLEQWRETERKHTAPWADFQTAKFMMQVPTSWIYKFDDPQALLKQWDRSMDVLNDLMGLPHDHGREVLYAQVDTQLRGRAFHPGYPSANRGHEPLKDYGGNFTENHLIGGPQNAISYEFHEMGHAFLFPKYPGDREAAVNVHHACVMNQLFGMDMDAAFRSSRGSKNSYQTLATTAITWMMSDNFEADEGMSGYERQYQFKGHAKFIDVARLFGWKALGSFFKSIQQDYEDGNEWPAKEKDTDRYTVRMSEAANADLRPLMHFWGIPTVDVAGTNQQLAQAGVLPSAMIYDALMHYRSLIPADRDALRKHALGWWGRQPSAESFTTERGHAARWESYDASQADTVRKVVDRMIATYFPDGRPADAK